MRLGPQPPASLPKTETWDECSCSRGCVKSDCGNSKMVVLAQMRVLECGLWQEAKLLCSRKCGCYKLECGDVHKVVLVRKRVL